MKVRFLKISLGILIFNFAISSLFCQNYGEEIRKLLPEGKVQFEVLDSVEATILQTVLLEKFHIAYQENYDAFNVYFEKTRNNQKAKYPKNKTLSEKEYLKLKDFLENVKILPSQTETLQIIYSNDNNTISFKASGKLTILGLIVYDAKTNRFNFGNDGMLIFKDFAHIETNKNALQEPWQGYIWEFSEMKNIAEGKMPTAENIDKISGKHYKITVGKLMNSGKTFMIINAKVIIDGKQTLNFELPIRMK